MVSKVKRRSVKYPNQCGFWVSDDMLEAINKAAIQCDVSRADLLREVISYGLPRWKAIQRVGGTAKAKRREKDAGNSNE